MKKNKFSLSVDWWLMAPVIFLSVISLVTLISLNQSLFFNQLLTLSLAIFGFVIFSRMRLERLKSISLPIYVGSIIILLVVLIIGIESKGAVRWIYIFGFSFQFSELLKPFLAFALSAYLASKTNASFKTYIISFLLLAPVFLLIAFQPDLGNAMIYALVTLFVFVIYGFPLWWFFLSALPFVLLSPFLWHFLHDYQRKRLLTFLNPTSDPLGASYNVIQAMIAVGSGMFMGKGLSQGSQSGLRFLPERHTDFIFATISEGLGFVGAFIVIACFIALCLRIVLMIIEVDDKFTKIFGFFTFGFIMMHFFINIGMNVGLVPIVGVTLPFVSYGGNSLLSNFIFLGIFSNLYFRNRRHHVLEIK